MVERVIYLFSALAVGAGMTYLLRAFPFLIFGFRQTELSPRVKRWFDYSSPIIIAGLIIYSYTGLAWQTVWPYLAGAISVGMQIWRGNPLLSILAGTIFYMTCLHYWG